MYRQGQLVVYGSHGVCRICGTEDRLIDRKTVSYYILLPLEQESSRFYLPANNPVALSKIRPIMEKGELLALLVSDEIRSGEFLPDEHRRKTLYRELITSCDCKSLLQMYRVLTHHRADCAANGRKFHLIDENFLRDTQRILTSELSVVLQIEPSEVNAFLKSHLE